MHVRELGEGPPVLLHPPPPCHGGTLFLAGVQHLARSHLVLSAGRKTRRQSSRHAIP